MNFSRFVAQENIGKYKKKMWIFGGIELGAAAVLLIVQLNKGFRDWSDGLLLLLLALAGVYTAFFGYRFYGKQMESAARRQYSKSSYLRNEVELNFCLHEVEERSKNSTYVIRYRSVADIEDLDLSWMLRAHNGKALLVSKKVLREEGKEEEFEKVLTIIRNHKGVKDYEEDELTYEDLLAGRKRAVVENAAENEPEAAQEDTANS